MILPGVSSQRWLHPSATTDAVRFTRHHEWIRREGDTATVGLTTKSVESLGELVFVEIVEPPVDVKQGGECGSVESVKAVSEIYSPVSCRIVEKNSAISQKPSRLNTDPEAPQSWLFRVELSEPRQFDELMTRDEYQSFLNND